MEAIYNKDGRVVGWRRRTAVFDPAGKPRAFISGRALFTYEGRYLGRFEDRWYRDAEGQAVAFEAGASGGPARPLTEPATPPLPEPDPPPMRVEVPPPPRMRQARWAEVTWKEFLSGRVTAEP